MEIIIIAIIILFIVSYRSKKGESVYQFIKEQATNTYKKIEPYSYKVMRALKQLVLRIMEQSYEKKAKQSEEDISSVMKMLDMKKKIEMVKESKW